LIEDKVARIAPDHVLIELGNISYADIDKAIESNNGYHVVYDCFGDPYSFKIDKVDFERDEVQIGRVNY